MLYYSYPPPKELFSVVKRFLVCYDTRELQGVMLLPSAKNFIVFNRGNTGVSKSHNGSQYAFELEYYVSMKHEIARIFDVETYVPKPIVFVELTEIGFYKLFNKPASILHDKNYPIDEEIIKKYFSELYKFDDITESITYLKHSLTDMLNQSEAKLSTIDIENVLQMIEYDYKYDVTIDELIRVLNCSRSTIEREFKKTIGMTPKKYILREKLCLTFIHYIKDETPLMKNEFNYYNYSYINHLFKKIFGFKPRQHIEEILNGKLKVYQIEILKCS